MKISIDVTDDDFTCLIMAAVRYCMGRRTYMPSLVTSYIKPLLSKVSNKLLYLIDYKYESCDTEFWGASVTAEQYGDCDKCGYTIRQAYSPVYEGFYDLKRGWKDSDGVYHEKNYKRHRRVRRKHLDRVKQVDQSWVVRYI